MELQKSDFSAGSRLAAHDSWGFASQPAVVTLCIMPRKLTVTTHADQAAKDRAYWLSRSPEERLDAVELLRIEAGKFLYDEYPCRLRRVITVTRRERS
jgi:hypothetical protein